MLDSAIVVINAAALLPSPSTVDIPATWAGGTSLTPANYVRLIRSYKAKLRAGVARTPTERAAVTWALVLADAQNGITADHNVILSSAAGGWSSGLDASTFQTSASWHQVSLMYVGMADTSGAYQTFIAQPYPTRVGMNVLVKTPDTRWPSGETRTAQVTNSPLPAPAGQYISNRDPGGDQPDNTGPFGTSQYDHRRYYFIQAANGNGTMVFVSKVEIDMLAAEADIRGGTGAVALGLVNASRTAHGLPAYTSASALASNGVADCVPRLPNDTCGTLLEGMKYEKRMETQLTGYMQWFLDSRGWGDLIAGTALHWPVPNQEMDTRNLPFYDMPSTGTIGAAAVGTYGF